jgi:hypothetical protein
MPKVHPLQVWASFEPDTENFVAYISKGHHDFEEFAKEVLIEEEYLIDPKECRHTYYRLGKAEGGEDYVYYEVPPKRGAMPVTVWDEYPSKGRVYISDIPQITNLPKEVTPQQVLDMYGLERLLKLVEPS